MCRSIASLRVLLTLVANSTCGNETRSDCEEDRVLRAMLVGMLREMDTTR